MEEQAERLTAAPSPGSTVSQIVWRAQAMGIDPDRVTRALGVSPPPRAVPKLPDLAQEPRRASH